MRHWSLPAGRMFGADLRIHMTFALLLLFVWMMEAANLGSASLERGLALVGMVFVSVVLHEAGHALATLHEKSPSRSIVLLPIGGITVLEEASREKPSAGRELRVALAGPAVNLLLALMAGSVVSVLLPQAELAKAPYVSAANLPRSLVWVNLFLGVFNLLPAYPADGGRVVRALLARRLDLVQATRRAVSLGQGFSMLFILAGIWNVWFSLVGIFLFIAAQLEDRSAVFQSVLEHVRLQEVMLTDFSTLSPADTLEDALYKAVHTLQDDFPVVRGSDLVGVISRQRILEALRAQGNGYVQGSMSRTFSVAQSEETLSSAFRKLTAQGMTLLPVVEAGRLVGIVTLQNLMHSMSLLAESKKLRRAAEAELE